MSNFRSLMYGGSGAACRAARRCAGVSCNACPTAAASSGNGGANLPGPAGACASFDVYGSNAVTLGCAPGSGGLVEGGVFDRHYYRQVDQFYAMYHAYCTRLAAMRAARRRLAMAARDMANNNGAAAAAKLREAANAERAAQSPNAERAAEQMERAANAVPAAANTVAAKVNEAANNKRPSVVAAKVNNAVEALKAGDVEKAGAELEQAANAALKEANRNVNAKNANAKANQAAEANNLKQLGENLKQAGAEMKQEANNAAQQRVELNAAEQQVQAEVSEQVKSQVREQAQAQVEAAAAASGNNGAMANGVAPASSQPSSNSVSDQLSCGGGYRRADWLSQNSGNSNSNSAMAPSVGSGLNAGAVVPPPASNQAPAPANQGGALTQPMAAARFEQAKRNAPFQRVHAQSIRQIYNEFGSSCSRCVPSVYKAHEASREVSNWLHGAPRAAYGAVVAEFGKPNWVANVPHGQAVWLNPSFFSRIELHDVEIPHGDHVDFLTLSVSGIQLPLEGIDELARLSESVSYDALTDTLSARCDSAARSVAALIVAIDLAHDDTMTLAEARQALPQLVEKARDPEQYRQMLMALQDDVMAAREAASAMQQQQSQPPMAAQQ